MSKSIIIQFSNKCKLVFELSDKTYYANALYNYLQFNTQKLSNTIKKFVYISIQFSIKAIVQFYEHTF